MNYSFSEGPSLSSYPPPSQEIYKLGYNWERDSFSVLDPEIDYCGMNEPWGRESLAQDVAQTLKKGTGLFPKLHPHLKIREHSVQQGIEQYGALCGAEESMRLTDAPSFTVEKTNLVTWIHEQLRILQISANTGLIEDEINKEITLAKADDFNRYRNVFYAEINSHAGYPEMARKGIANLDAYTRPPADSFVSKRGHELSILYCSSFTVLGRYKIKPASTAFDLLRLYDVHYVGEDIVNSKFGQSRLTQWADSQTTKVRPEDTYTSDLLSAFRDGVQRYETTLRAPAGAVENQYEELSELANTLNSEYHELQIRLAAEQPLDPRHIQQSITRAVADRFYRLKELFTTNSESAYAKAGLDALEEYHKTPPRYITRRRQHAVTMLYNEHQLAVTNRPERDAACDGGSSDIGSHSPGRSGDDQVQEHTAPATSDGDANHTETIDESPPNPDNDPLTVVASPPPSLGVPAPTGTSNSLPPLTEDALEAFTEEQLGGMTLDESPWTIVSASEEGCASQHPQPMETEDTDMPISESEESWVDVSPEDRMVN